MANQFSNVANAVSMANQLSKKVPLGLTSALVAAVIGVVLHAMLLGGNPGDAAGLSSGQPATQPVEMKGAWLGMNLSSLNTPAAAAMGIPPTLGGVLVEELRETTGWRASQAGVVAGDVITAVEGKKVRDLAELAKIASKVDVNRPVLIEMLRWGQPVTLILPAPQQAFAVAPQMVPQRVVAPQVLPQQAPVVPQALPQQVVIPAWTGPQPAALNPAAWNAAQVAALNPVAQPVLPNGRFYCPRDGCVLPAAAVSPNFRCPNCNGPLGRLQ